VETLPELLHSSLAMWKFGKCYVSGSTVALGKNKEGGTEYLGGKENSCKAEDPEKRTG
jgi:hypothetical protein